MALLFGLFGRQAAALSWQTGGQWFRRGAGILIGILGLYFIANPFFLG